MSFDWLAYAEKAAGQFIAQFADLDSGEHPDKVAEIAEARRLRALRDGMESYREAVDKMLDEQRQFVLDNPGLRYDVEMLRGLFPLSPLPDNFGIKAEDVRKRIEELRGETNQSER